MPKHVRVRRIVIHSSPYVQLTGRKGGTVTFPAREAAMIADMVKYHGKERE